MIRKNIVYHVACVDILDFLLLSEIPMDTAPANQRLHRGHSLLFPLGKAICMYRMNQASYHIYLQTALGYTKDDYPFTVLGNTIISHIKQ